MYTMRPAEFTYHRPTSLDEAIALLGDEARPLAGGHSLLPMMKLRLATPEALVDLGGIPELAEISSEDGGVRIGAMATHHAVAESELVQSACPILAETAADIGDRQVRHRGTIGGSLAHADPGADYPIVLTALGATATVTGPNGERTMDVWDCVLGIFTTALEAGELITSVTVPATPPGTGAAYVKHDHPASGFAVVGVAAVVTVEGGNCTKARVVVGGVTGRPVRATAAQEALTGGPASAEAIEAAAAKVAEALEGVTSDTYASGEYRTHLAPVLAKRALTTAFERA
jgi:aerobic carbon-monoxide dehydrogenase medium subunit